MAVSNVREQAAYPSEQMYLYLTAITLPLEAGVTSLHLGWRVAAAIGELVGSVHQASKHLAVRLESVAEIVHLESGHSCLLN